MIKKIFILFLTWRILLFIIAILAPSLIPVFGNKFPYVELLKSYHLPAWAWAFGNFDGVHYLRIARDGYAYGFTQAFFPLYPVLIKVVSYLTLGNYLLSALLVSNVSFLIALIIFHKLIKKVFDEKIALWSTIFLVFSPTSFYFGSVYTESTFFLFTIAAFYLVEKERYLLASVFGFFASATRLVGVFLAPTLIKKSKVNAYALIIAPLGLIFYMTYLKISFNNPLYFLTAQSAFGQSRTTASIVFIPQVVYRSIAQILTTHGLVLFNSSLDLIFTIVALIILLISFKFVKKSWIFFSIVSVILPTLTGSLISMPRYILIAFPIFITLAHINNNFVKSLILIIFISALIITTALFTRGYWIA